MKAPVQRSASLAFALPMLLVLAAAAFRYAKLKGMIHLPALENFSPWMALAFTGTLVFPRRVPFLLTPLLLLVVSAAALGAEAVFQWEALGVYATLAAAAMLAGRARGKLGLAGSLAAVAGCSIAFYIITNTISWASYGYAKNLNGWIQALTTGEPGLPPTWWFLRSSLLSDLGFSVLLLAAHRGAVRSGEPAAAPVAISREVQA